MGKALVIVGEAAPAWIMEVAMATAREVISALAWFGAKDSGGGSMVARAYIPIT
jgi:hypothetical protein